MEIKDLDGQRSLKIETTEGLPDSIFVSVEGKFCYEFDRGVFLNAARRMGVEFTAV